jgi:hypothetical protein
MLLVGVERNVTDEGRGGIFQLLFPLSSEISKVNPGFPFRVSVFIPPFGKGGWGDLLKE